MPLSALAGLVGASLPLQLGSSLFSSALQSAQAEKQYEYNLSLMKHQHRLNEQSAQKTRDWQTEMSNTQYQRSVSDLRQAGLNPILAVGGLSGASTPSGATASTSLGSVSQARATPLSLPELSQLTVNSALAYKYRSEADLARSKIGYEDFKSSLGKKSKGAINSFEDLSNRVGSAVGKAVGDLLFNRNKTSAAPIMSYGEGARRMERLQKQQNYGVHFKRKNDPPGVYSRKYTLSYPRKDD